jgi:hypothetical protein
MLEEMLAAYFVAMVDYPEIDDQKTPLVAKLLLSSSFQH